MWCFRGPRSASGRALPTFPRPSLGDAPRPPLSPPPSSAPAARLPCLRGPLARAPRDGPTSFGLARPPSPLALRLKPTPAPPGTNPAPSALQCRPPPSGRSAWEAGAGAGVSTTVAGPATRTPRREPLGPAPGRDGPRRRRAAPSYLSAPVRPGDPGILGLLAGHAGPGAGARRGAGRGGPRGSGRGWGREGGTGRGEERAPADPRPGRRPLRGSALTRSGGARPDGLARKPGAWGARGAAAAAAENNRGGGAGGGGDLALGARGPGTETGSARP